jgi:hypothetical protein
MAAAIVAASPVIAHAQTTTVSADRIRIASGPCLLRAGTVDPEGAVVGNVCDLYLQASTGTFWIKATGTATDTGWSQPGGLNGAVSAPIVQSTGAVIRQRASELTNLQTQWLVDGPNGTAYLDAYNTDAGGSWIPLGLRASRVFPMQQFGSRVYASQTTGWNISPEGGADFRYVFANELHAKSFVADLEQALAGGQIISKSVATLAEDFTVPSASGSATLHVKDLPSAPGMAVFESGDTIRLRTFSRSAGDLTIADAYGTVTSHVDIGDGTQTWTFTRLSSGGGAMSGGTTIAADALALDYGVSGNGFMETSAVDGTYGANSPYVQAVTWSTAPGTQAVRARLGNLKGITSTSGEYGLIAGDISGGHYVRLSNSTAEAWGLSFNLKDGGGNTVISLSPTAPSIAIGQPLPSAYGTGTGVWAGNDSGTYKFRVGNPSGNRLTWDGSTLAIVGDGSGLTSINGGNITTGTVTATQIAANTITATQIASGTITADRMNVSALSAITANLGSVTVSTTGSLSSGKTSCTSGTGFWISANSGTPQVCIGAGAGGFIWDGSNIQLYASGVEIDDAHGIRLDNAGSDSDFARSIWWSNGAIVQGRNDVSSLHLRSPGSTFSQINLYENCCINFWGKGDGNASMALDDDTLYPDPDRGLNLGASGHRWESAWIRSLIHLDGDLVLAGLATGINRYLCIGTDGTVYAATISC